jgi:transcriptional regulator with XRE-family HTH domain
MPRLNFIGTNVLKLRHQRGWTQQKLHTMLELAGCVITRQTLANLEIGRTPVNEERILFFAMVFGVRVEELFPEHLRDGKKMKRLDKLFTTRRLRFNRDDESDAFQ